MSRLRSLSIAGCTAISAFAFWALVSVVAHAQQSDCGSPPSFDVKKEDAEAIKGELSGKAQGLAKFLGDAELAGRIERERKSIYQTFEGSEANRKEEYLYYMFCMIIMQDKNATTSEKLDALEKFRKPLSDGSGGKPSLVETPAPESTPGSDNSKKPIIIFQKNTFVGPRNTIRAPNARKAVIGKNIQVGLRNSIDTTGSDDVTIEDNYQQTTPEWPPNTSPPKAKK